MVITMIMVIFYISAVTWQIAVMVEIEALTENIVI